MARKTKVARLTKQVGVYATAKYLKGRGYDLYQALLIIYAAGGLKQKKDQTQPMPIMLRQQAH